MQKMVWSIKINVIYTDTHKKVLKTREIIVTKYMNKKTLEGIITIM